MDNKIDTSDSRVLADEAVKLLLEKQGLEIKLYDMREREAITDFYINVTGKSAMHTSSLADELYDKLSELGRDALRIEGRGSDSWVLVDYGDLIVNVFDKKSRDFYDLDRLLPAETLVDIEPLVAEVDAKFEI
ncbi:MAG: ribosome silencing factor [Clostridia bacterium]|nr:ribosome silencing factor [Clostridia bacterium]